ncbi:MAG: SH3 domain-containing protein [Ignavibacteria bacterium]|nr:SH3 domain-containing protein [Ignavibacteria bacterium]
MKNFEAYPLDNILGLRKVFESTLEFQGLAQNHTELVANIHINGDGTFSVGNESVSQEEILEYINDFSINYESYIDSINGFIEQLKNLSNPVIKVVLIYLFIPYFIAIFANLTTSYWEEQWNQFPNLSTREVKKEIISSANGNYNSQFLRDHPFVATKILYVRKYESTRAEMVDELYIGKTVKVIDKKRSWCLIEYQDSDANELKQGWVFSRYTLNGQVLSFLGTRSS